jgi:predicted transcriptional regulator
MAVLQNQELTKITVKDIAETVQCADSTIRNNLKIVREAIGEA